ncbi:S41 family peptidase [Fusibacter bizertensis]
MAQARTGKKDPKVLLMEKKLRKQRRNKILKSVLAIFLALLLIGTALAPVFSQTVITEPYRVGDQLLTSDQGITITAAADTTTDVGFHDFIDFMMETIQSSYFKDVDSQALIEGAYKGIFNVLDPYSTYFTPAEYESFNTSIEGEFSGIGASITEGKNGYVEVVAPIKDTPADRAGLQPGDMITEIDGVSAAGFTTEKAVTLIRGEKGTAVKLTIKRPGLEEPLYFNIVRDTIIVKSVNYKMLDGGVGYIQITEFGTKTNGEFDAAMAYMTNNDVKKLVVDVRNNPGGLLDSAIHISDYFIPAGKQVVKIDYKGSNDKIYRASTAKAPMDVAVLVNGGSASASEIFSGSIQQTDSGVVIGTKSFGKGTVQNLMPLTNGGAIKLTIAEYLLNGDYHVHGIGITPDIEVKAPIRMTDELMASLAPLKPSAGAISLNVYGTQQRLALLGYDIVADGQYGPATKEIVKQFQALHGLTASGTLTTQTMEALTKALVSDEAKNYDPQLEAALAYFKK